MAQPQVPKNCSFERTLETVDVASKKISTFPAHIFEESGSKGFLTGLYILLTDLPRVSISTQSKKDNLKNWFYTILKGLDTNKIRKHDEHYTNWLLKQIFF